jgi:hypothetical protein
MATPRKYLAQADWPQIDRIAWAALFTEGDLLDDRGAACHWAAATRKSNAAHYGRWLSWLNETGHLGPCAHPADRLSKDRVAAYGQHLMAQVAPRTVASSLIGLKCTVQRMAPERDWRWLKDLTNRLDSWAPQSAALGSRILPAERVLQRVLEELGPPLQGAFPSLQHAVRYRNIFMIGLLTAWPIRLRNFAALRSGEHVFRQGADWRLEIPGAQTKTKQPLRLVLPQQLRLYLEHYLNCIRPSLPVPSDPAAFWSGTQGKPLAPNTIYQTIMRDTQELFGIAINPHSFRSIAATSLAEASAADALYARPLLGHRLPATTETHYIRARQIESSRKVTSALAGIRKALPVEED